jgi:hypothetical protein
MGKFVRQCMGNYQTETQKAETMKPPELKSYEEIQAQLDEAVEDAEPTRPRFWRWLLDKIVLIVMLIVVLCLYFS